MLRHYDVELTLAATRGTGVGEQPEIVVLRQPEQLATWVAQVLKKRTSRATWRWSAMQDTDQGGLHFSCGSGYRRFARDQLAALRAALTEAWRGAAGKGTGEPSAAPRPGRWLGPRARTLPFARGGIR